MSPVIIGRDRQVRRRADGVLLGHVEERAAGDGCWFAWRTDGRRVEGTPHPVHGFSRPQSWGSRQSAAEGLLRAVEGQA